MNGLSLEGLKLLLMFSISLGIWVLISLCANRTGNRVANQIMALFVALSLLPAINVYSQVSFGTMDWCWILATHLTWLYGPVMYSFIQQVRQQPLSWKAFALHASPFLVTLALRFSPFMPSPFYLMWPLFILVFTYLIICTWIIVKHRHEIKASVAEHKTAQYAWMLYLVGGLYVLMLVDVSLIYFHSIGQPIPVDPWRFLVALFALYLQGIAFFSLYRPRVFFNDCIQAGISLVEKIVPTTDFRELDQSTAKLLEEALATLMNTRRPYLDNDLSLAKLSSLMEVRTHQLSELLNRHMEVKFYDYVNRYRVDAAINLLESDTQGLSILDIAFEAGFNNKNTFYRMFRERTGVTPSQYRKSSNAKLASMA